MGITVGAGVSAGWLLVEKKRLSASADTIVFSNIDLVNKGPYLLTLNTKIASATTLCLIVNGDEITSDYRTMLVRASAASVVCTQSSDYKVLNSPSEYPAEVNLTALFGQQSGRFPIADVSVAMRDGNESVKASATWTRQISANVTSIALYVNSAYTGVLGPGTVCVLMRVA